MKKAMFAVKPPHRGPARILVVDDHPMLRRSVCHRFEIESDIRVCAEADSVIDLLETIRASQPDAVLLDLRIGDRDAFPAIREIRARMPDLPILVFSIHSESLYAQRCLEAGANGYLMKADAADHLLPAMRAVLAGETYLSDAAQACLSGHPGT